MEVFADAVVLLEAERRMAAIVEVQLAVDDDKRATWPVYVPMVRRELGCPCVLLVVALDDAVARWCARPIETGHPGFVLRPLVVRRDAVPRILDPERASRSPELAVLSAIAHGADDDALSIATTAIDALARTGSLDNERGRIYFDLVLAALGDAARIALEELMSQGKYEYQSDFAKRYVAEGKVEGRAEGKAEGTAEGVLAVLAARGISVDAATEARVRGCADRERLDRWLRRAAVAVTLEQVFDDG